MKKKNHIKSIKARRIQFEAPPAMVMALDAVKKDTNDHGLKMTYSQIVRIAVSDWLVRKGMLTNSQFGDSIGNITMR